MMRLQHDAYVRCRLEVTESAARAGSPARG